MRALTLKSMAIAFWAIVFWGMGALSAGTQASAAMAERIVRTKVSGVDIVIYPMGVQDVVTIAGNLPAGDAYAARGNLLAATATGILIEKGTTKQDKFAIAQQLDDVGAQLRFSVSDQMLSLNAKSLKVRKQAGRFSATVDLRGLKKGAYTLTIRVVTASGKTLNGKRRYHTCATRRHGSGFHAPL